MGIGLLHRVGFYDVLRFRIRFRVSCASRYDLKLTLMAVKNDLIEKESFELQKLLI